MLGLFWVYNYQTYCQLLKKENQTKSKKDIELNPKIPQAKDTTAVPINIAKSNETPSSIMTETLAQIYLEQKKYENAIKAYRILILKYPEKSGFFADRIKAIKNLQKNKS